MLNLLQRNRASFADALLLAFTGLFQKKPAKSNFFTEDLGDIRTPDNDVYCGTTELFQVFHCCAR